MVFHCRESNCPQVSRSLLSILTDLNIAEVWMICTPLISKSCSPCINPFVTRPRAQYTISIVVPFMSHSFFLNPKQCRDTSPSFTVFQFYSVVSRDSKVHNSASSLLLFFSFLMIITIYGHLAEIRWSLLISKSQRNLCVSFSRLDAGLRIFCMFEWPNFNIMQNSPWITLPTQPTLFLYSFCVNLLHSRMWLIISYLLPYKLRLLFCCILSIVALIWVVLMSAFCAAIRIDSVSLLSLPFLSPFHVFLHETSLVSCLKHP